TSNRVKVNDREKLKKKVRDGKKKKAKLAKKNVQWKSKHKKDPGIPNEFPYKDQILAEVAEQRRIAAEDKQRRKEEKQKNLERARAIARGEILPDEEMESAEEGSEDEGEEGSEDDAEEQSAGEEEVPQKKGKKDLNVGAESIASLSAKQMDIKLKARPKAKAAEETVEEEDEVPVLINRDLPNLQSVIDKADVVIELLDARDPDAFRNKSLEDLVVKKGKKLLLVLNKIDTCPKEAVTSWAEVLRKQHPTLVFRSATSFLPETSASHVIASLSKSKGKSKAKAPTNDAVGRDVVLECLSAWRKDSGKDELNVAVVGIVNAGKSSFINSVNKCATLPVYTLATSSRGPSTTELPQEVALEDGDNKFTFIDTPGLSFNSDNDEEADSSLLEEFRARDILLRSKGRIDRLKDPSPPVEHIVSRANTEDLMVLYSLPAFSKGDPVAFLSGVARANQLVKKKGELDLSGAARIVLRDWNIGKFAKYTLPPSNKNATPDDTSNSGSSTASAQIQALYAKQDDVIAALTPRKELRKTTGLVKLTPSSIDSREPEFEEPWAALNVNDESDDEEAEDEEDGMDVDDEDPEEGSDEDEEEGSDAEMEDEEEEEEEETPSPPVSSSKRKRGPERAAPAPPAKKVAFTSKRAIKEAAKADALKEKANLQMPKPVQPTPSTAPVKSALKTKKAASAKSSEDKKKSAANVPSAKAKVAVAAGKKKSGEPEAYDFGKFF
ncbi:hypothetical protein CVT24_010489, partial [Panaeolus cyanescens]